MNCRGVEQEIVKWIRSKVKEAKCNGAVIGLSGGIDSSVSSVLTQKAVGKSNFLGLIMPCHSDTVDEKYAKEHTAFFNMNNKVVNLSDAHKCFEGSFDIKADSVSSGNLRSRMRMCTLYYYANAYNYLVIGTTNKTEAILGYYTKFGDGGIDLEPIIDLYKFEVYELARYLGVPESIINRAPTAGLWGGQTDEKELGITYKEIDEMLVNGSCNKRIKNLIKSTEHKREMPYGCYLKEKY